MEQAKEPKAKVAVGDQHDAAATASLEPSSLLKLPTEVLELIVAKCAENDVELLEATTSEIVQRVEAAGKDKDGAKNDEDGWETASDKDEHDAEDEESIPDLVALPQPGYSSSRTEQTTAPGRWPDDGPEDEACSNCGEVHGTSKPRKKIPESPILAIHQLAKTNKLLRALVLPEMYRGVDFEGMPNLALQSFVEVILPNHGHLVQEVHVLQGKIDPELKAYQIWCRITANENEEFIDITPEQREDPDEYLPDRRYELIMKILEGLPNLTKIDTDLPSAAALAIFDEPPEWRIQDNIISRGSKLRRLCLTADSYDTSLTPYVLIPILRALPKLELLELSGVDRADGPELRDIVTGMEDLQYLEMCEALCVTDDWADVPWKGSLKALMLEDCQEITAYGVEKLLGVHRLTLRGIELDMIPLNLHEASGAAIEAEPFDFPKLQELSIVQDGLTLSYMQRFALCPNLYRIQLGGLPDITDKELATMITDSRKAEPHTFPALKEICLSPEWLDDDDGIAAERESLELICFEHGITLVQEEDSDIEEDDDDEYDSADLEDAEEDMYDWHDHDDFDDDESDDVASDVDPNEEW